jgi:hypothetical protein
MVPTTAVITVVNGGAPTACIVHFRDGTSKSLQLPETKINHFLDDYLTTTNADANLIREVRIRFPGRLESLDADIVDTPGVNDIDAMREEITFQHLKHADAVIVVLDAQQPVSESERTFLTQHVKPADIAKMLFVLNRIDEKLASADHSGIDQIEHYAETRLSDMAGVNNPKVFGLSARSTLKARVRGEHDPYSDRYVRFEETLFDLASKNAAQQRMLIHIDRIATICQEQIIMFDAEVFSLSQTADSASRKSNEVKRSQSLLSDFQEHLPTLLSHFQHTLANRIRSAAEGEVELLRRESCEAAARCDESGDFQPFRSEFSWLLRRFLDQVEKAAWQNSRGLKQELLAEHQGVLRLERFGITSQRSRISHDPSSLIVDDTLYESQQEMSTSGFSLADGLGSGAMAMILHWLFPGSGLIQMLGGLLGGLVTKGAREGSGKQQQRNVSKMSVARFLNENLDRMESNVERLANDLASQECNYLTAMLNDRIVLQRDICDTSLKTLESVQLVDSTSRKERSEAINVRLTKARELLQDCARMRKSVSSTV